MYLRIKYLIAPLLLLTLSGCNTDADSLVGGSSSQSSGSNSYSYSKTVEGFDISLTKGTPVGENYAISINFEGAESDSDKDLIFIGHKGTVNMSCREASATIGYRTLFSCVTKYNTENIIGGKSTNESELYLSADSYKVNFKEYYLSTNTEKKLIGTYLVQ